MSPRAKLSIVAAGYVLAIAAAFVAGWLYDMRVAKLPYDTSGGMYAGGQLLQSLAAFFAVALVPTLLGLWFLRRNERFWQTVAAAALGFAAIGLVAVAVFMASSRAGHAAPLALLELFGLAQLLGVPLWFTAFALCTALAPTPKIRRTLVYATLGEALIGVCAAVHWFR